jgi:carbon starvation protein
MSLLKLVFCGSLAVLGSVSLAFVVGFVNPQEKVNGLWLVMAAA